MEAVRKQAYKLKLHAKWRIHHVFHVLILERDIIKKEAIDQKIANQLKFEKGEQTEQEVDLILDIIVFAEKVVDGRLSRLYYLIY